MRRNPTKPRDGLHTSQSDRKLSLTPMESETAVWKGKCHGTFVVTPIWLTNCSAKILFS